MCTHLFFLPDNLVELAEFMEYKMRQKSFSLLF